MFRLYCRSNLFHYFNDTEKDYICTFAKINSLFIYNSYKIKKF